MTTISSYSPFIEQRQQLIKETNDPALKKHYQAEIDLVKSWDSGDIRDPAPTPHYVPQKTYPDAKKTGKPSEPVNETR